MTENVPEGRRRPPVLARVAWGVVALLFAVGAVWGACTGLGPDRRAAEFDPVGEETVRPPLRWQRH